MTQLVEEFLQKNPSFECEKLHAKITPEACGTYQLKNPKVCKGCEHYKTDTNKTSIKPRKRSRPMGTCAECGKYRKLHFDGKRCFSCVITPGKKVEKERRDKEKAMQKKAPKSPTKRKCMSCGEIKAIHAHGICNKCYMKSYRRFELDPYEISIDFNHHQNIHQKLVEIALEECRTPEQQILWIIKKHIEYRERKRTQISETGKGDVPQTES